MTNRRLRARRARTAGAEGQAEAARKGPRKPDDERKDFLIQARVPRDLDDALKREAKRRRLSVSHLIRNVLEDTFELVDGVLGGVDDIVQDSLGLADQVRRDAKEIARSASGKRARDARTAGRAREAAGARAPDEAHEARAERESTADKAAAARMRAFEAATADVYAWNPVVLNRQARCARCEAVLDKGATAHLGLSAAPSAVPRWLCAGCLAAL